MFQLVWTIIWHFRIEKEKKYFHFGNDLTNLWASIYQLRTKLKLWRLLAEHKTSIFRPKFEKLLWGIWKIKSLASNLNLCLLNQLECLQFYQKDTLKHVFSCKYCNIANNSFLYRTPLMAASRFFRKLVENNCEKNHFSAEFFSETS